ncbi:MAG: phosphatase PAP2 family protein [Actinomycetota bacterium]|nr:phosphatase PAP2 family protein [Actinomycetota bacterium]
MRDTTTGAHTPSRPRRTRRYTRPLRGSLTASAGLAFAFVLYTWLVVEWSPFVRLDDFLNRSFHVQSLWPVLTRVDRIGQRAVCLPILFIVVGVTAWRHRSWRPVLLAGIGVFVVNLLVLIAKLALMRGRPLSGRSFFSGGDMYPSGHTANILVVYGLCYHLVTHYGRVSPRMRRILLSAVCVLSVVMLSTSLLLRWHWFSDLIGGFLVGGAVLALTVGIDAAVPFRSPKLVVLPAAAQVEPAPAHAPPEAVPLEAQPVGSRSGPSAEARDPVSLRRTRPSSPAAAADRRSGR